MLWISEGHDFHWLLRLSRCIIIKSKRACGGVSLPLNECPALWSGEALSARDGRKRGSVNNKRVSTFRPP
jgi:hypothetical protein